MFDLVRKIASLSMAARAAVGFERAWDLYVDGQYAEADSVFSESEKLFNKLTVHAKIMKGSIKYRVRNREECAICFEDAWFELKKSRIIKKCDKDYLMLYIYKNLALYDEFDVFDASNLTPINDADVSLENVSKKWKRRFPIRDHPDWAKHGIGHSVSNDTALR